VREVTQVVEASRKHGSFDLRWPSARQDSASAVSTAAPLRAEEAAEALEWETFSNRYFPGRRRHNIEALTAYVAYTRGLEWRTTPARLSVVATEHVPAAAELEPEEAGARRLLAAIAVNQMNRGGTCA
jgi:hypothetical protein